MSHETFQLGEPEKASKRSGAWLVDDKTRRIFVYFLRTASEEEVKRRTVSFELATFWSIPTGNARDTWRRMVSNTTNKQLRPLAVSTKTRKVIMKTKSRDETFVNDT